MRFKLGSKIISLKKQPYFIAEIGVNFENDLKRAKKIIKLAKEGGADAVKFQSYKAEKIACKKVLITGSVVLLSHNMNYLKSLINLDIKNLNY